MVDGPLVMRFLTTPVLPCPRLCLMELVYSLWRIPGISIGSGTPVLTVNALSIKLDGIAPFVSPVLSESLGVYHHASLREGSTHLPRALGTRAGRLCRRDLTCSCDVEHWSYVILHTAPSAPPG